MQIERYLKKTIVPRPIYLPSSANSTDIGYCSPLTGWVQQPHNGKLCDSGLTKEAFSWSKQI